MLEINFWSFIYLLNLYYTEYGLTGLFVLQNTEKAG